MAKRVYNFNPGPATLPYPVLEEASKSVLEFENLGMSLLEISHRSKGSGLCIYKVKRAVKHTQCIYGRNKFI